MGPAAAFLLAAAVAASPAPADEPRQATMGAQVASSRISVRIVRPAVLKGGALASPGDAPRSQRRADGDRVVYAFE
jgi:hypothetical protein